MALRLKEIAMNVLFCNQMSVHNSYSKEAAVKENLQVFLNQFSYQKDTGFLLAVFILC